MAEENQQTSKEEQIAFYKGALSTLVKEREEMQRILQVVEQLMQMHIKSLKELGVDLAEEAKKQSSTQKEEQETDSGKLDDMLK
ncbi:MAG: hypothetical protein ACQESF_02100 [Nanobdellota archaeon]